MKTTITASAVLVAPVWERPFRCHVDASQRAVGGTLTQMDEEGRERVIACYSKKLSSTEEGYTANEREFLALIYFLKRFRCYLEGTTFEVFTDSQVLNNFFTKPSMNRKEASWLDLLSQLGISKINLKPGRVHVLGVVLSRAPHITSINRIDASNMKVAVVNVELGADWYTLHVYTVAVDNLWLE